MSAEPSSQSRRGKRLFSLLVAAITTACAALIAPILAMSTAYAAQATAPGDSVYIGRSIGHGGTPLFPIWYGSSPVGEPDSWAYCLENRVSARTNTNGEIADPSGYLGGNLFLQNQSQVYWVLGHGYPALSLEEFRIVTGVPTLSQNDAIEAVQYAIWRYTDLGWDAEWSWSSQDARTAYWYLVNGANAASGAPEVVTASITAPVTAQQGTLVGPFTVHLGTQTGLVHSSGSYPLVHADGTPLASAVVVDGQQLYLDLRGTTAAGSATITLSTQGATMAGQIISVPVNDGAVPTAADHAQTIALVSASIERVSTQAQVQWAAATGTTQIAPQAPKSVETAASGARVD